MTSIIINSNGETFTKTDYNGISVIVDSNGYYNASKICKDNKKLFKDVSRNKYWTEFLDELSGGGDFSTTQFIVEKFEFSNEVKGFYIHPKLVNWLCMHLDYKYAIKVSEIMDLMNERIHINNSNLEEEIEKLKKENEELKKRAVPKGTNNKLLRILKLDDNNFKITADSHRSDKYFKNKGYEILDKFILPASMNVRDVLKKKGIIKSDLRFKNYENCYKFINENFENLMNSSDEQ